MSIFARPSRVRGVLAAVQQGVLSRPVYTEDQLHAAIGEVAARFVLGENGYSTAFGGEIVIAAPFKVRAPVIIPPRCTFLTIRGLPGAGLVADDADQGVLFRVQAPHVTLERVLAFYASEGGTPSAWFNTFVQADPGQSVDGVTFAPQHLRVLDCRCFTDRLFVDASGGDAAGAVLERNYVNAPNGTHDACVVLDSERQCVIRNDLDDGGGDSVTIGANAEGCDVSGNDLGGGDVTSTASLGSNRVWSNTRTGTLALHGTDSAGGNT